MKTQKKKFFLHKKFRYVAMYITFRDKNFEKRAPFYVLNQYYIKFWNISIWTNNYVFSTQLVNKYVQGYLECC